MYILHLFWVKYLDKLIENFDPVECENSQIAYPGL